MAYFDSPKNRALWDKELANLRKIKADRAAGRVSVPTAEQAREKSAANQMTGAYRVRTSYKELLKEETREIRARRGISMETQKVKTAEKSNPSMAM